jgi:hypothetical protein
MSERAQSRWPQNAPTAVSCDEALVTVCNNTTCFQCLRKGMNAFDGLPTDVRTIQVSAATSTLEALSRFTLFRELPSDHHELKHLYLLSASLQFPVLRDALEAQLEPQLEAHHSRLVSTSSSELPASGSERTTPVMGADNQLNWKGGDALTLDEYLSGRWRALYAPAIDERAILSSFDATPPLPQALFNTRSALVNASTLPNPFGIGVFSFE